MRSTIIAMLHRGRVSINKMDKSAGAFWWQGLHREIRDEAENCPSCQAAGKNQLDFAGPIKSKSRGYVYI